MAVACLNLTHSYLMTDSDKHQRASSSPQPIATEAHYRLLKALEQNPKASQRQLATELGISVGKTNYCIRALIDRGWVKARNFRNSDNKLAYAYVLTPSGLRRKTALALRFLEIKRDEFEALRNEIDMLAAELDSQGSGDS